MWHNLKLTFMTSIIFCFIKYVDLIKALPHHCANFTSSLKSSFIQRQIDLEENILLKELTYFPGSFGILRRLKVYFRNKLNISSCYMSSRTDFGLIHLVTPPHLFSSCQIPCKGKNVFWQSRMCWLATRAPPSHLQREALTEASLPSTCWVALNFQALHYLWDCLPALKFDQYWPGISRATAEQLTDGRTDAMNKRNQIQEFLLLHSITSLASYTIFCLKKMSLAFSPVLPSACNYPTEMQILWSFHQK